MANIDGYFLNVFNTSIDEELDKYNRSLPEYHVTDNNNVLDKPYRFTRSDIERSSVLIPDLSKARPGDILVNFSKREPLVGIVVNTDFSNLDSSSTPEEYMQNITVVSTNSGFRMVNIGVWLNSDNVYGGLAPTGKEKSFYLRRLLVKPSTVSTLEKYPDDNFEMFDVKLQGLDVDLVSESDEPWVPNTG